MAEELKRLQTLIGEEGIGALKEKTVLVAGIGGVGSFAAEALARSGIGRLILTDSDDIEISNLNRQLMSSYETVGRPKVEVMKERIASYSAAEVITEKVFIDEDYAIPEGVDYIADCIDTLSAKMALAEKASARGIPLISAMGVARRMRTGELVFTTLDKTSNDPLARNYRQLCRRKGFDMKNIRVVINTSETCETKGPETEGEGGRKAPLGSSVFPVGILGLKIAEVIVNELLKEDRNEIQ